MKQDSKWPAYIFTALFFALSALAQTPNAENTDPHYTELGFFDVHLCNWPDRPPFYMALFSTVQYQNISGVRVYFPDGKLAGELDMTRYRTINRPGKPEKHVFITHLPLSNQATDGWFSAIITTLDGREMTAKDYVVHTLMPIIHDAAPAGGRELSSPPIQLTWSPAPGATHYQVTLRDEWNNNRVIYTSALVTEPRISMPPGLLQQGGRYSWVIHARDSNGNVLLGDFNHGSMSAPQTFSIAQ
ncbi:hypothetical protein ACFDAU_07040 [Sulfuriferula sp. GW1]|uniref:hypothetical protein n=1 Tax=Sulfuriferula sp. GW1 TaxID=3345111 RepID=UPI0039B10597